MEAASFSCAQGIGAAERVEAGVPEGFAGIDVADAGYAGLVEEEFFYRAAGGAQEFCEIRRRELRREGVDAE